MIFDYTETTVILAVIKEEGKEKIIGIGRYAIDAASRTANSVFTIRDDYQHRGIGRELLSYLTYLGEKQGLLGFTAEVLYENTPMLNLFRVFFEEKGFVVQKRIESGVVYFRFMFREV